MVISIRTDRIYMLDFGTTGERIELTEPEFEEIKDRLVEWHGQEQAQKKRGQ